MVELPGSVLFACTLNAIRSPMAEALLKHFHGRRIFVRFGRGSHMRTRSLRSRRDGRDRHRHLAPPPKSFDDLEDDSFDLIISLSPEAQHRAVEMTRHMACEVEFWNTFDPCVVEGSREVCLEAYREVRESLTRRILERFPLQRMGSG